MFECVQFCSIVCNFSLSLTALLESIDLVIYHYIQSNLNVLLDPSYMPHIIYYCMYITFFIVLHYH